MGLPQICPMTVADLDATMAIERRAFKYPWSRHMYLMDLSHNRLATYLVVKPAAEDRALLPAILAYGGFWLLVDEAHIATIASHPDWRGCGLGQRLLIGLLEAAIERNAIRSTLEVRVSNLGAQELYRKLGYEVAGVRPRYYQDGENALIMTTPSLADPEMQIRLVSERSAADARLRACFEHVTGTARPAGNG